MVERAGVYVDPVDAFAPGKTKGLGKQPAAVALAGMLRYEANERELALARFAKVQFDHSDFLTAPVEDHVKFDLGMLNHGREMCVIDDEPRKPQPGRAD